MGIKSFFKKVRKVAKRALPYAAMAAPFIPGIGPAIGGAISKVGSVLGLGSSAQSNAGASNGSWDVPGTTSDNTPPPGNSSSGTDWGKVAGQLAPIAIGGLNYLGQQQTNSAQAAQAQAQMDFQASQTGTSYQRGVADMKAAGLNPMLAYSQGGAASGTGAQAQIGNELGAGANSAFSTLQAMQAMEQTAAQTSYIEAQRDRTRVQTINDADDNPRIRNEGKASAWKPNQEMEELNRRQLANYLSNQLMQSTISNAKDQARITANEATRTGYDLSKHAAESGFWSSKYGKSYPYVSRATEQANSAANVVRKFIPFTND